MAYFTQEMKKEKTPIIKSICKKYGMKATLSVQDRSTFIVTLKEGTIDFVNITGRPYSSVNPYSYNRSFDGVALEFLTELIDAMNVGNHNNSDVMTDYFDVGFYIAVNIGKWDKPYKFIG